MSNKYAKAYNMAAVARCFGAAGGRWPDAERYAQANMAWSRNIVGAVKAAATSTGGDDLVDGAIYYTIEESFIEALRSVSAFDAMSGSMRQVPLRMPIFATSGVVGAVVAEGGYAPVSELGLMGDGIEPAKAQALVVLSNSAFRTEHIQSFLQRELTLAVGAATNAFFLPAIAAVAADEVCSGSTAAHVFADVEKLLGHVSKTGASELFLVVGPDTAASLACKNTNGVLAFADMSPNGGTLCGVRVLVSDQLPTDSDGHQVLLIDADGIAHAPGGLNFERSTAATIRMSTEPGTDIAPAEVNLFQNDLTAILANRTFGFEVVRANVAALLTAVQW